MRLRLEQLPASKRAFQVEYRVPAGAGDSLQPQLDAALSSLSKYLEEPARLRIWDPVFPADERGTTLVALDAPERAVAVTAGRLPRLCFAAVCEGLALGSSPEVGAVVRVGEDERITVVGQGSLIRTDIGRRLLQSQSILVHEPALPEAADGVASTVVVAASVDPAGVRAHEARDVAVTLRQAVVRAERLDPSVSASAPAAELQTIARQGAAARNRALLVASQGVALLLAFAALAAVARRSDWQQLQSQLRTLSGSRRQALAALVAEIGVPVALGTSLGLLGVLAGASLAARSRSLPPSFVEFAVPRVVVAAIVAAGILALGVLLAVALSRPRSWRGIGGLEIAALTALGVILWQASTTDALDPAAIAGESGGRPLLLLSPALTTFAGGILLLRLLPFAFRLGERMARRSPLSLRLALLNVARAPTHAAAATAFLAVSLGGALFSFSYRETLERQGADAASFRAGAPWRVVERGASGQPSVAPLTRFQRITRENPVPILRLGGVLRGTGSLSNSRDVEVVALPRQRLDDLIGWRPEFSRLDRDQIGRRLATRASLDGPRLIEKADGIRIWARGFTTARRSVVVHLLLPGQAFSRIQLGSLDRRWTLLHGEIPPRLRGARVVAIEFTESEAPGVSSFDEGAIDLGPLEQRVGSGWSEVARFAAWAPAVSAGREASLVETAPRTAPVDDVVRLQLNGVSRALLAPDYRIPDPLPALVSPSVAASAVDGRVTLTILGRSLDLRIAAVAKLFPTVTSSPDQFAVLDYDALFAALNAASPGLVTPSEAWFFQAKERDFLTQLGRPPFQVQSVVEVEQLRKQFRTEPLAVGTKTVLLWSGVASAVLAVLGLGILTGASLRAEAGVLAEYQALGATPRTIARSTRIRVLVLSVMGMAAAVLGGAAATATVASFVALTASAERPLPPIAVAVAWRDGLVLLAGAAGAAVVVGGLLAGKALRTSLATRLRM